MRRLNPGSSPVIAIGAGLGVLAVRLAKKDAPRQAQMVMSAAGGIAALAVVFHRETAFQPLHTHEVANLIPTE